jgi:UDP-N-acetylmuramyl pentapeptide phosphotransferase/UDP-N-acetylglucosamine-1-phosphate transferase
MKGYDKASSYNERFRRSQIRRGRNCIYYQSCMLAVAYATTVAVFMINIYITIVRCIVANKSTASRQRQCHDECMPKPTQGGALRLSMISNMTSVTLAQKMYVPLLLWTLVATVVKMDMQQRVNCRIKCYSRTYAHTQSTHTIRAVAGPKEAVGH